MQITKLCRVDLPGKVDKSLVIRSRHVAQMNYSRKIRQRTPRNNESSWRGAEDSFIYYHRAISKSPGAHSRMLAEKVKQQPIEFSFPFSVLQSAHVGRFRILVYAAKLVKICTSETSDIPYTALTAKFPIEIYRWELTTIRSQKSRISARTNSCKVWISLVKMVHWWNDAAGLQDGRLSFYQYLYKDFEQHLVQRCWSASQKWRAQKRRAEPKGCPTNPEYAQTYFGTPPWTALVHLKIPHQSTQIPASPSKSQ